MMGYRHLADGVVLLHFAFLLFVVFGGLLVLFWWRVSWLHLPAVIWGTYVEFYGRTCPLTPLENALRKQAGGEDYAGGFIDHYIVSVIYPPGLTPAMQMVLGAALVTAYAVVYALAWRRHRARTKGQP